MPAFLKEYVVCDAIRAWDNLVAIRLGAAFGVDVHDFPFASVNYNDQYIITGDSAQ